MITDDLCVEKKNKRRPEEPVGPFTSTPMYRVNYKKMRALWSFMEQKK